MSIFFYQTNLLRPTKKADKIHTLESFWVKFNTEYIESPILGIGLFPSDLVATNWIDNRWNYKEHPAVYLYLDEEAKNLKCYRDSYGHWEYPEDFRYDPQG